MTSNLASDLITELRGLPEEQEKEVNKVLAEHFRPEFLNRLDDIIIFQALSEDEIAEVVKLQLAEVEKRLKDKQITLEVTQPAAEYLAAAGYDPIFGARPLKRLIQNTILDQLSMMIIEGEVEDGATVTASIENGELVLHKT